MVDSGIQTATPEFPTTVTPATCIMQDTNDYADTKICAS